MLAAQAAVKGNPLVLADPAFRTFATAVLRCSRRSGGRMLPAPNRVPDRVNVSTGNIIHLNLGGQVGPGVA